MCSKLFVPTHWLCYVAPELMRAIKYPDNDDDELPFSEATDVYAFGSVSQLLLVFV